MNSLQLRSATRERNRCSYWDYYVDDRRLADVLDVGDFIPPIGWLGSVTELHFLSMLLRAADGDLSGNRAPLFVCAECADYGCGVLSCNIDRTYEGIVWRDFGMQTDYDDELIVDDRYRDRIYTFDPTEYYRTFSGHYDLAKSGG
ncbi:hypothetical protein FYK55_26185 [Roseiconus nitratireducens]|uniref:Uncharacterized protein n=1 Tax=Roseiconus nitratireducens TaxID=2605748 RepID=A0A5M6CUJ6_9BACT|nr:hypothetical protein [Roseiconus nitratireducens]KAA5538928.1 hypothetical protein FYK55_26185 [Roseiconus nitratireducens]